MYVCYKINSDVYSMYLVFSFFFVARVTENDILTLPHCFANQTIIAVKARLIY